MKEIDTALHTGGTAREIDLREWVKSGEGHTPEKQAEIEDMIKPYAAFQMMIFLRNTACRHPVAENLVREYMQYMQQGG